VLFGSIGQTDTAPVSEIVLAYILYTTGDLTLSVSVNTVIDICVNPLKCSDVR